MNLSALPPFIAVDLLVRFRRLSTLVLLAAMLFVAWLWIPDPSTGRALMVIDGRRALYTSGAIGLATATLATLFIGLFGFYAVSNSIARDLRTRCGQILASTPLSSGTYLLGRWAGNLVYLCLLTAVFAVGSLLMVLLRGEGSLELWRFASQYLLICIPPLIGVASLAIFFEVTPILRTRAGDVGFFILWMAILGGQAAAIASNREAIPWLDLSAFGWMLDQLQSTFGTESVSIGATSFDVARPPIRFDGIPFTVHSLGERMKAIVLPLLLLIPTWLIFHRFDPAKISAGGAGRQRRLTSRFAFLTPLIEAVRPPAPRGILGAAVWDARLTLLERPIIILAVAAVWIASLAAGADAMPLVLVVAGLLAAPVASREPRAETFGLIGTSPLVGSRFGLWKLLVSLGLVLAVMAPMILRTLATDPLRATRMIGGALLLAGAANLLGFLTRGSRTFVAALLALVYVAASSGGEPALDFAGFAATVDPKGAALWGLVAVAFVVASLLVPRFAHAR